jgi:hypothetical protein
MIPRFTGLVLSIAALILTVPTPVQAQDPPRPGAAAAAAPQHALPLLQDRIPEAYREHVPLPFGVSFNYFRLSETLALRDPVLAMGGYQVPSQAIQAKSLKALTDSYTVRFDAWILPFLDVYGTATHFTGEASDIQASVIGSAPVIPSSLDYEGNGVGTGFTAAFGYRAFFASYDYSFHWQFMKLPSSTVKVAVQGPRVGLQFKPWGFEGNVYAGAMKESVHGRQVGTLTVENVGSVDFDIVATAEHAWNPTVGAELGITRHIRASVEAGFRGRNAVLLGAGYRF